MLTGADVRGWRYSGCSKWPLCAVNIFMIRMGSLLAWREGSVGEGWDVAEKTGDFSASLRCGSPLVSLSLRSWDLLRKSVSVPTGWSLIWIGPQNGTAACDEWTRNHNLFAGTVHDDRDDGLWVRIPKIISAMRVQRFRFQRRTNCPVDILYNALQYELLSIPKYSFGSAGKEWNREGWNKNRGSHFSPKYGAGQKNLQAEVGVRDCPPACVSLSFCRSSSVSYFSHILTTWGRDFKAMSRYPIRGSLHSQAEAVQWKRVWLVSRPHPQAPAVMGSSRSVSVTAINSVRTKCTKYKRSVINMLNEKTTSSKVMWSEFTFCWKTENWIKIMT